MEDKFEFDDMLDESYSTGYDATWDTSKYPEENEDSNELEDVIDSYGL